MKAKQFKLVESIKNIHHAVEHDMKPYEELVRDINQIDLSSASIEHLQYLSALLRQKVQTGATLDSVLIEAFALVRETAFRVLGQRPFDVQLMAAIALHQGKVVEMQTGEGKTLTAVMPAYLNALTGKGVHVLTFNDYLAGRDAKWMKPIYECLGLRVGYVREGMDQQQRKDAYQTDITYITAKEAGFDYLRDFLCTDKTQLVQRPFHYALLDEADSILIDEARIPLVIAGDTQEDIRQYQNLTALAKQLIKGRDYELDDHQSCVYLTDTGLVRAEEWLKCGNLYDSSNLELLSRLNCALQAELLLKRDKDYIVRNGKVEIIDEFTGRIADKRHWPDNLHAAVETKEGVQSSSKGAIMGSISLQHFISLYPKLAGMTGTAKAAANELREYYNLSVVTIPTNKPCIRIDHEDAIFIDQQAKYSAIVKDVAIAYQKRQPVLIGTVSVEESEKLAHRLKQAGIDCTILNAKNDEVEAQVIAKAGELGAVTVSTNMAGRGVDIKLGGIDEQDRTQVAALGGLYIIGTNRHESRRIDDQLRGRAGRQGDPGETRFMISLEDDWIKKYNILQELPTDSIKYGQDGLITDATIMKLIQKGQRLVEGYYSDMRAQQWKYSFILEQQRRIIHKWRQGVLMDELQSVILQQRVPDRYERVVSQFGQQLMCKVEKQLTLYFMNKHWMDYLDYISYIRESIHLVVIGRMNPLYEFNKQAVEAFMELQENIQSDIVKAFETIEITEASIDLEKEGLKAPSSTWTYLINEDPDQFSNLPYLMKALSNAVKGPLFTVRSLFAGLKRKIKSKV